MGEAGREIGFKNKFATEYVIRSGFASSWATRLAPPPLHFVPQMAPDLREMRSIVSERQRQVNGWKTDSSQSGRLAYREVALRNSDRARRHWLWGVAKAKAVDGGPIRTGSGGNVKEPYEDEFISYFSRGGLAAQSSFPVVGPDWNSHRGGQQGDFAGDLSAPKKMGSPPNVPSRRKVSEQDARVRGDKAFTRNRRVEGPGADLLLKIADGDVARSGGFRHSGRPGYKARSPMGAGAARF